MPSICKKYSRKKYSRKRNNRKRGHSRRRMRRKSRHASYNRRRRNMFGGEGGYQVEPYDAGNDSTQKNYPALQKLIDLGYVGTTSKFTSEMLDELRDSPKRIILPDTDISLQKNQNGLHGQMVVEVSDVVTGQQLGQVMLKPQ